VEEITQGPRRGWEENIKLDFKKIGCEVDWIHVAQNRIQLRAVVNTVMNLRVLQKARNLLTSWVVSSFHLCPVFLSLPVMC